MTIPELKKMVGEEVIVSFVDGGKAIGVLGYTDDTSTKFNSIFFIGSKNFRVRHVKKVILRSSIREVK